MRYLSPLRYPGGKARLAPFIGALVRAQDPVPTRYAEPYAGGRRRRAAAAGRRRRQPRPHQRRQPRPRRVLADRHRLRRGREPVPAH